MDPKLRNVRHAFIAAVKAMDPPDAVVLRHLHSEKLVSIYPGDRQPAGQTAGIANIASSVGFTQDEVEASIRRLLALELLDLIMATPHWQVNALCRVFMDACYPRKET
jgi:hypothetical protein